MSKRRFTEEQIVHALRHAEEGPRPSRSAAPAQTCSRWQRTFAGMGVMEVRRRRQVEEHRTRQRLVADLLLAPNHAPFSTHRGVISTNEERRRGGRGSTSAAVAMRVARAVIVNGRRGRRRAPPHARPEVATTITGAPSVSPGSMPPRRPSRPESPPPPARAQSPD